MGRKGLAGKVKTRTLKKRGCGTRRNEESVGEIGLFFGRSEVEKDRHWEESGTGQ